MRHLRLASCGFPFHVKNHPHIFCCTCVIWLMIPCENNLKLGGFIPAMPSGRKITFLRAFSHGRHQLLWSVLRFTIANSSQIVYFSDMLLFYISSWNHHWKLGEVVQNYASCGTFSAANSEFLPSLHFC